MKDRNNLLTSMIVALLAGIVYYLAGADSIERLAPQFGLVESRSQNKNDIEIVFSPAEGKEKVFKQENPVRYTMKHVSRKDEQIFEVKLDEVHEIASKTNEPSLEFVDAMELLKNTETDKTSLGNLESVDKEFEWNMEQDPEVERPSIAWTESEKSHSLKSKVKTRIQTVHKLAKAAVFLGEGDIMTGKFKIRKEAGSDKNTKSNQKEKKTSGKLESINGDFNFIWDAKDTPHVIPNGNNLNVIVNTPETPEVNVTVKSKNGVNFITVTSDDKKSDCKVECKVKCNGK